MLHSISRKLVLLVLTSLILFGLITSALFGLSKLQDETHDNLQFLMQVQLSIDQLRSQLWVFLQYNDSDSLQQVNIAQANLAELLSSQLRPIADLASLQRMNNNLSSLIEQEMNLYPLISGYGGEYLEAQNFLHSRYNMLIQSMTEELLFVQRRILDDSTLEQQSMLVSSAIKLTLLSGFVALIAFFIFRRFRHGYVALKTEMLKVTHGGLKVRVEKFKLDSEFQSLLTSFNKMKESLIKVTISRDEMEEEIKRKTEILTQQKDRLLFLSEHDPLTGLLNRRAFDSCLNYSINSSSRAQRKFALLFLDLNKFKQINDNYGHDIGDHILQQVAKRITEQTRATDFLSRLGGDEFVICLTLLTDFSGIERKVKRIKTAIEHPIVLGMNKYDISASIGVSYFPDDGNNAAELMKKADMAMYIDKQRN